MNQEQLNSFLTNMFESRVEFASINGTANTFNTEYMLVADAISENVELLAGVVKERFEENLSDFKYINSDDIKINQCARR